MKKKDNDKYVFNKGQFLHWCNETGRDPEDFKNAMSLVNSKTATYTPLKMVERDGIVYFESSKVKDIGFN